MDADLGKARALAAALGADAINVLDWAVRLAASVVETLPDSDTTEDAAEQLARIQSLLVSAYREASLADLPGRTRVARSDDVLDCLACGATIAQCDKVCRESGLTRSCCPRCKQTATHTPAAHARAACRG